MNGSWFTPNGSCCTRSGRSKRSLANWASRTSCTSAGFSRRPPGGRPLSSASSRRPFETVAICPCLSSIRPFREAPARLIMCPWQLTCHYRRDTGMATKFFEVLSRMDRVGVAVTRIGLIVVLLWIGGLKTAKYEAEGIAPFVAHSPFMSFFYSEPSGYTTHRNPEGALVPANRAWHEANGTYTFALGLGAIIVIYG